MKRGLTRARSAERERCALPRRIASEPFQSFRCWRAASASALVVMLLNSGGCRQKEKSKDGEEAARRAEISASQESVKAEAAPAAKWYRAVLSRKDMEVPFWVELQPNAGEATLRNGSDSQQFPADWDGEHLTIRFPLFGTSIKAEATDDGRIRGVWNVRSASTLDLEMIPLSGVPPAPTCKRTTETDTTALAKSWAVHFEDGEIGSLSFEPQGETLRGLSVTSSLGDAVLWGQACGDDISLALFDGSRAVHIAAHLEEDGTLTGSAQIPVMGERDFVATPVTEKGELSADRLVVPAKPKKLPLLATHAEYRGVPLIVDVFGTWCINCHDAIAVLKSLYEQFHGEGLEILSLGYELEEDDDVAREQLAAFAKRYDVPWRIELVPGLDPEKIQAILPPGSPDADRLPIALFVDRQGLVRALHFGFLGPSAGAAHDEIAREFERLAREIVASKAAGPAGR